MATLGPEVQKAAERGDERDGEERQRPHHRVSRGHVEGAVGEHEAGAVEDFAAQGRREREVKLPGHREEVQGRNEAHPRHPDRADRAQYGVEGDGHALLFGDHVPRGVEPRRGDDEGKSENRHIFKNLSDRRYNIARPLRSRQRGDRTRIMMNDER